MAFVTGYSLVKYEQAINNELVQRLRANVRQQSADIKDYEQYLGTRMQRYKNDSVLITYLSMGNFVQIRAMMRPWVRSSLVPLARASLMDRDGQLVVRLTQDEQADARDSRTLLSQNLYILPELKDKLDQKGQLAVIEPLADNSLDLIMMTRLTGSKGRHAGYVEEIINIGGKTLENLKKRLGLEIMLFDGQGNIVAGSHPDFLLYNKNLFSGTVEKSAEVFFDLNVRDEPYGFIISPMKWGETNFLIGLGASKQKSKAILKNINYAFFTVAGAIFVLVSITALVSARVVMRPLNDLLQAIVRMEVSDKPIEIPVKSENEIGVLTESFNIMSRRVHQARSDLENKVKELENAYAELKDAQAKLVHSAKMASLGQLVAGVAHELNNPIGFIFSNMGHLRDYSSRLLQLIEAAEKNPQNVETLKKEYDFDYIVQDLPRLIQSCEDGARRVRDIVVGLRNFSRLEEAKIKRIDLADSIEQTLRLLAGELKGRIRVHTEFADLPEIVCYASQLNQVFMNILSNAAQAIDGEGDIWVSAMATSGSSGSGLVRVSIRDSGRGMPHDIVDKIFDPFFTTKTVGEGTGLGLSISYGIVRKHGGDISVKSEIGKGTEFIVTLPIDGPPGASAQAAS